MENNLSKDVENLLTDLNLTYRKSLGIEEDKKVFDEVEGMKRAEKIDMIKYLEETRQFINGLSTNDDTNEINNRLIDVMNWIRRQI